jgi:hypothetical protein
MLLEALMPVRLVGGFVLAALLGVMDVVNYCLVTGFRDLAYLDMRPNYIAFDFTVSSGGTSRWLSITVHLTRQKIAR